MRPQRRRPDDPVEWLNRARSNLIRAKSDARLEGVCFEDLCFDAQQASEKAIKGVLIQLGVVFPYVHDLGALIALIERAGLSVPEGVREAARLTRFALVTRYPGLAERVTKAEYDRAVAVSEAVVR